MSFQKSMSHQIGNLESRDLLDTNMSLDNFGEDGGDVFQNTEGNLTDEPQSYDNQYSNHGGGCLPIPV